LEPTTIREIFFEKASVQRKDSVEVARPSAVAPQVHVHSSKVINEWYSGSHSLGKQRAAINIHGALLELVRRRRGGRLFIWDVHHAAPLPVRVPAPDWYSS